MRKLLNFLFIIQFLISTGIMGELQAQTWEPGVGPYGGDIRAFANNDTYIFAGVGLLQYGKGVFRSADGGISWTPVNNGFPTSPYGKTIYGMLTLGPYVFASTFSNYTNTPPLGSIYRSADNGNNWVQLPVIYSGEQPPSVFATDGIAIAAGNPAGCRVSVDSGMVWEIRSTFPGTSVKNVKALTFSGGFLYAGLSNGKVYRSSNYGVTWLEHSTGLSTGGQVQALTTDGTDVFVGKTNGICRLINNGNTWTIENTGLPTNARNITSLAIKGDYVYASGTLVTSGIYRSPVQGQVQWVKVSDGLPEQMIRNLHVVNDNLLAGVASLGIFQTSDDGANWAGTNEGLTGYSTLRLTKSQDTILFVTMNEDMVFRSIDRGNTFEPLGKQENYVRGANSAGPLQYDGAIFLSHFSSSYASYDNGNSWTLTGEGVLGNNNVFYAANDKIYAGCGCVGGVYYSTNKGADWNPTTGIVHPLGYAPSVKVIDGNETRLFAGTLHGMFYSDNQGINWLPVSPALPETEITGIVVSGNKIFAGTGGNGIYKSDNNGNSWTQINSGLGTLTIQSLVISETKLFAGTPIGVYCSENEGLTWFAYNEGYPMLPNIITLTVMDNQLLSNYMTTGDEALYVRTLSGTPPSQPGPISANATPCVGSEESYSIEMVAGVSYSWHFPSDWTIVSGGNTNIVTVLVGSVSGIALVTPSNGWGVGPAQFLLVNPTACALDKTLTLTSVYLEGLYSGPGQMNQASDEYGAHYGAGIADAVTVELRNAADYATIAYSTTANLSTSGAITLSVPSAHSGSYYITIRHRNSVETTTASPVSFSGTTVGYAFNAANKAYGDNLVLMASGDYAIFCGDVNQDQLIDASDMAPIENGAAQAAMGYLVEDCNGDGLVDGSDLQIAENNAAMAIGAILP